MIFERATRSEFDHCVHCGLCLPHCPTYMELANENDSPRGRLVLMQALDAGRIQSSERTARHLSGCLDCRACETACPSGVRYGHLLETFRIRTEEPAARPWMQRTLRWLTLAIVPHRRRLRAVLHLLRCAEAVGLLAFLERSGLGAKLNLPVIDPVIMAPHAAGPMPAVSTPATPPRATLGLFAGCVNEVVLGSTNRATLAVLQLHGHTVHCPEGAGCCGALHYHAGDADSARAFARRTIDAFDGACPGAPVVVNAAGCGLMMKDFGALLADDPAYSVRAAQFAGRVRDVHEVLAEQSLIAPPIGVRADVVYHEACHLCHGQGIRSEPRVLLDTIPHLTLHPLQEATTCCGAAGTYALFEPDMAQRLAERKLAHVEASGATVVAAANVGCILHLRQAAQRSGRQITVCHPIDLLASAHGVGPSPISRS